MSLCTTFRISLAVEDFRGHFCTPAGWNPLILHMRLGENPVRGGLFSLPTSKSKMPVDMKPFVHKDYHTCIRQHFAKLEVIISQRKWCCFFFKKKQKTEMLVIFQGSLTLTWNSPILFGETIRYEIGNWDQYCLATNWLHLEFHTFSACMPYPYTQMGTYTHTP